MAHLAIRILQMFTSNQKPHLGRAAKSELFLQWLKPGHQHEGDSALAEEMEATSCLFTCLMPGNQWCTCAALKKEEGIAEMRQKERSIGIKNLGRRKTIGRTWFAAEIHACEFC